MDELLFVDDDGGSNRFELKNGQSVASEEEEVGVVVGAEPNSSVDLFRVRTGERYRLRGRRVSTIFPS